MKLAFLLRPAAILMLFTLPVCADRLQQATVTRMVNQVEVLPPDGKPQAASIGEIIRGQTGIRTGQKSRTELTFPDNTLARLGANTVFSFQSGSRNFDLSNGTLLLQVPKGAGGGTIKTAPVTAAITGTTLMLEYSPGNPGSVKLIVLEGEVRLSLNGKPGESVVVRSGQMVAIPDNAKSLPNPSDVDLARILRTSRLINDGELSSMDVILADAELQRELKNRGILLEVNYALRDETTPGLNAGATQNAIDQRRDVAGRPPSPQPPAQQAPPPPPPPPPPLPPPKPPHDDDITTTTGP